jgi:hypothetical protein
MKNIAWKYGSILGGAIALQILIEHLLGLDGPFLEIGEYVGFSRYVIMLIIIYLALKDFSNQRQSKSLSLYDFLQVSVGIVLISAILVGLAHYAYHLYLNPNFFEDFQNHQLESFKKSGASIQELNIKKEQIRKYLSENIFLISPIGQGIFYFFETFIVCLIMAGGLSFWFNYHRK